MNKHLLTFLLGVILCVQLSAQNNFEKGYIINNDGSRVEGLIKNMDWNRSPSQIEFKQDNSASSKLLSIDAIKEFEVDGKAKYVRSEVDIDMSSDDTSSLDDEEKPSFTKKTALLRVIVEGEYTLYGYNNENIKRFFYQKDDKKEPLVFKRYMISGSSIAKNNTYIKQLQALSNCENIKASQISGLEYRESDLRDIFVKFNSCKNADYKSFEKKSLNSFFHVSVRPGVNFSSLDLTNGRGTEIFGSDFGSQTNFRIGVEVEYVMPFNNNKWAIMIEPTYQYFKKTEKDVPTTTILGETVPNKATVKYSSIEVPIGVRYYAFLNKTSKLFFNASFIFDVPVGESEAVFERYQFATEKVKIKSATNFGFGVGYKYKDRYSVELNMHTKRSLLEGESDVRNSDYKNFSIIFGYTLF
ncbi:porin family protein [Chryseobacterium herbae]|uniref:PorT family protein n=1 Tax=Chryseobacterium herbae TaxID=2976476 RepID=A0ABT2IRF6_9FLAO|nr:porin family protein [Chryseobacterium sp. pc1-10]MCT2561413.1 PorT family protein [Chryseobacterium sp. pc1-10]